MVIIKQLLVFLSLLFIASLSTAQTLTEKDTATVHFLNARKFYIYKVEKGETLFSISQKFKIPQEEILQFNNEINKSGLKAKMKLWIPAYSWLKKDSIPELTVSVKPVEPEVYTIAIVTSLNLPKLYLEPDSTDSYVPEPISPEVNSNLEFVEGALYAADILKSVGIKVHLIIIDSESDTIKLLRKLRLHTNVHLIISNEYGNLLKSLSNYSKNKNIKLFSIGINTLEFIRDNEHAFSLLPSSASQCEEMGEFSGRYFRNSTLFTINTSMSKENERSDLFQSGWLKSRTGRIVRIDYPKNGIASVPDSLIKATQNVFFVSSSNEDFVSMVLNNLKPKIPEYNVSVVGLPTWQYFQTIDPSLMESCNVHLFSSGFINYQSDSVIALRKFFRDKYNCEPSENAFQGYDALLVAEKLLAKNGINLLEENIPSTVKGIYSEYSFSAENQEGAHENQVIHVFQPAKDMNLDLTRLYKFQ